MPMYNYECPEGHLFEKLTKVESRDKIKCPTHLSPSKRVWAGTPPAALNANGSGGYYTPWSDMIQLGRTFASAKEQDAFMAANDIACISEHEQGRIHLNKKDPLKDNKEYQKEKAAYINAIKSAGGVQLPGGDVINLNDKNDFVKVDPNNPTQEIS